MLCIAMLAMQAGIFAKRLLQPIEEFAFIPGKIAASPAHIAAAAGQWLVYGVVLAVQPLVPPLLAIAHNGKGGPQKNAAIALGRLAKNPRLLMAIKDNHGIEILARAMKGKVSGL